MDTATRYSGSAVILIRFYERDENFSATVRGPGGSSKIVGIRLSQEAQRRIAIDSAEAFDKIAHAALSFAENEGLETAGEMNASGNGWEVARRKPSAKTPKIPKGVTRRK